MIAVFPAIRRTLALDKRLVFAGYWQATLITAKTLAIAVVAAAYTSLVLLAFWWPGLAGWAAILAAFTVIALAYGAFGLLLGVLVRNDLEGFFLIIMGSLIDTFLQNPLGNPLANKPVLQWFPSFGPTQFAVVGAFGHTALWDYLTLGLAWPAAFAAAGLLIFRARTRTRTHHDRRAAGHVRTGHAMRKHALAETDTSPLFPYLPHDEAHQANHPAGGTPPCQPCSRVPGSGPASPRSS